MHGQPWQITVVTDTGSSQAICSMAVTLICMADLNCWVVQGVP